MPAVAELLFQRKLHEFLGGRRHVLEAVIHRNTIKIEQGAVLGVIGLGNAGSLASSVLVGTLETIWSN